MVHQEKGDGEQPHPDLARLPLCSAVLSRTVAQGALASSSLCKACCCCASAWQTVQQEKGEFEQQTQGRLPSCFAVLSGVVLQGRWRAAACARRVAEVPAAARYCSRRRAMASSHTQI